MLKIVMIIINIGSGNGLVPSGKQAITGINVDQMIRSHMASLGYNLIIS